MVIALQGDAALNASQMAELQAQVRVLGASSHTSQTSPHTLHGHAQGQGSDADWGAQGAGAAVGSNRLLLQLQLQAVEAELEGVRAALEAEARGRREAARLCGELQHQLAIAHSKVWGSVGEGCGWCGGERVGRRTCAASCSTN